MSHPLRPLRYWMTGCVAVMSLSVGGPRSAWADERAGASRPGFSHRAWQASRFGLAETLHRLEACAGQHGLGVLLRWVPEDGVSASEVPGRLAAAASMQRGAVLVFEPLSGAGTPVVMCEDAATPDLPLSLRLRTRDDGRAEVRSPAVPADYAGTLPPEAALGLDQLPGLVADALA